MVYKVSHFQLNYKIPVPLSPDMYDVDSGYIA